jgi:precorrin-8X/cobalt-precorrin-8 methylmutase
MAIIESEIGNHNYDSMQWNIVRRVIHATADFDFARENRIIFSANAIKSAFEVFKRKGAVVADVNMVLAGINKQSVSKLGIKVICNISNENIRKLSKDSNFTISALAMRFSNEDIDQGIVAVGNAPTALIEVLRLVREDNVKPSVVIGVPVGFVAAAEVKDELLKTKIEFITNCGRKGGSPVASSIINALMLLYKQNEFL